MGPSIVLALYVFGHRVTPGILIIQKKVILNVSKNDLDNRFNLYQSMKSGIDEISEKFLI